MRILGHIQCLCSSLILSKPCPDPPGTSVCWPVQAGKLPGVVRKNFWWNHFAVRLEGLQGALGGPFSRAGRLWAPWLARDSGFMLVGISQSCLGCFRAAFQRGKGNVYRTFFLLGFFSLVFFFFLFFFSFLFFFVCVLFCARECELLGTRHWQFSEHGRKRNPSWAVAHPLPCSSRKWVRLCLGVLLAR